MYPKHSLNLFVGAALLALSATAQAITIDLFSEAQSLTDLTTAGQTASSSVVNCTSILGCERDAFHSWDSGSTTQAPQRETDIENGYLVSNLPDGVYGRAQFQWDGMDGNAGYGDIHLPTTTNTSGGIGFGLNLDLSGETGISFSLYNDLDATLYLTLFTDQDSWSRFMFGAQGTNAFVPYEIALSVFAACSGPDCVHGSDGPVDLQNVGAIVMDFSDTDGSPAGMDIVMTSARTSVPEPETIALLSAGILLVTASVVRRRDNSAQPKRIG